MKKSPKQFAAVLTQAIRQVKAVEDVEIATIQEQLGNLLNREGNSYFAYLRKGHVPSALEDLETLALALVQRRGLHAENCERLLRYGGHPAPKATVEEWFMTYVVGDVVAEQSRTAAPTRERKSFVTGLPIKQPSQFYGRERELRRIFGGLQRFPLTHMAIIGARRSGKTSLLHYVRQITQASAEFVRPDQRRDWLAEPHRYRWVFVDFQRPSMQRLDSLLRYLLAGFGIEMQSACTLDIFIEAVADRQDERPVVMIMDELGAGLAAPELDQRFWWGLRSLVNDADHDNLAFIVASSTAPQELAEDRGKASPFFNVFGRLTLGPFLEEEAWALIASSPIPFAEDDVRWILEQSGGWPCMVQLLCEERLNALEEGDESDGWRARGQERIEPLLFLRNQ